MRNGLIATFPPPLGLIIPAPIVLGVIGVLTNFAVGIAGVIGDTKLPFQALAIVVNGLMRLLGLSTHSPLFLAFRISICFDFSFSLEPL